MRSRVALVAALSVALLAGGSQIATRGASADSAGKVQICHFTSSEHNEFVVIEISTNAVSKHVALHGNPINGQGDDGYYDPSTDTCAVPD